MANRDRYIKKPKDFSNNTTTLGIFIAISIFIIILRLSYLQIIRYEHFYKLAKNNSIRLIKILPARGIIKTSDGAIYATDVPTFSVYYTRNLKINKRELEMLSKILNIPLESIIKRVKPHVPYSSFLLSSNVSREEVFKIMFHKKMLKNVNVDVTPKRFYPENPYVYASVVGYVSEASAKDLNTNPLIMPFEYVGRMGIESKYNAVLMGKTGYKEFEVNAYGNKVKLLSETSPQSGKTVILTINSKLQSFLYKLLKNKHSNLIGKYRYYGSIIVMRTNGAILGMVSEPSYNPNVFVDGLTEKEWKKLYKNKEMNLFDYSTQAVFPPGSVIKPFIAIAALDANVIKPTTILYSPPFLKIGNHIYKDWNHSGFGKINLYRALASSSDVFFYQVGEKLGIKKIDIYLSQFGFGKKPPLFNYDSDGVLPSPEEEYALYGKNWYLGDTIITTIGQGYFLVSPLQVAIAFQMIANNGVAYKPYLVDKRDPSILYVFKSSYYKIIKNALWEVVNKPYGTAYDAKIYNLNICGKTGTSQIVTNLFDKFWKEYKEGKISENKLIQYTPDAWFASFAPRDHPKIVVVVFLRHGLSSWYAAALAKKIYLKLEELHILK